MINLATSNASDTVVQELSEEFVWDTFVLASRKPPGISPAAFHSSLANNEEVADLFYRALLFVYQYVRHRCLDLTYGDLLAEDISQTVLVSEWEKCLQIGSVNTSLQKHLISVVYHKMEKHIEQTNAKPTQLQDFNPPKHSRKPVTPKPPTSCHPNDSRDTYAPAVSDLPPPFAKG